MGNNNVRIELNYGCVAVLGKNGLNSANLKQCVYARLSLKHVHHFFTLIQLSIFEKTVAFMLQKFSFFRSSITFTTNL